MIRKAARRASLPVALIAGAVVVVAAVATLAGSPLQRAVALGLYGVGSFMVIVGFALGSRSLFRSAPHAEPEGPGRGEGLAALWETAEVAGVLIVIGLVLLAAGVAVDPRVRLV